MIDLKLEKIASVFFMVEDLQLKASFLVVKEVHCCKLVF